MRKMLCHQWQNLLRNFCRSTNTVQKLFGDWNSCLWMAGGPPTVILKHRCGGLAEIVAKRCQQQQVTFRIFQSVTTTDACCLIADVQSMHPDVTFGVPLRVLGDIHERCQLGEQPELPCGTQLMQYVGRLCEVRPDLPESPVAEFGVLRLAERIVVSVRNDRSTPSQELPGRVRREPDSGCLERLCSSSGPQWL